MSSLCYWTVVCDSLVYAVGQLLMTPIIHLVFLIRLADQFYFLRTRQKGKSIEGFTHTDALPFGLYLKHQVVIVV